MQTSHNLEECLRETACMGNVEKVEVLVRAGVNVNSQNTVNGWTALHWAGKRNHKNVVSCLLRSGADPTIRASKDELAVDLTQNQDIKQLLLGQKNMEVDACEIPSVSEVLQDSGLGVVFVPNYLQNPEFPYSESATEFADRLGIKKSAVIAPDAGLASSGLAVGPWCDNYSQVTTSENPTCFSDESLLVLKCRLADSEEKDFVEIELDEKKLNFAALVETCVTELNIDQERIRKIRKLPNTLIRNDRDVKRLVQHQEIEIIID